MKGKARHALYCCLPALLATGCAVFVNKQVSPVPVFRHGQSLEVRTPARVHMRDGSVVVFPQGLHFRNDTIFGWGTRHDRLRRDAGLVFSVPVESLVGVERYDSKLDVGALAASSLTGCAVSVSLFKLIFGSCPTIYTFDGSGYALEAEAFSYSIAPLMEGWDLDRLDLGRPVDGEYRLMVANEALETHYINCLSLVAADHPAGCEAFPTDDGRVVVSGPPAPMLAAGRDGRDLAPLLGTRDSVWYETDTALVRLLADTLVRDWIDIAVPVPEGARRMTLALRVRNTLLNTVAFCDVMMIPQGITALRWLDMGKRDFRYALRLRDWYNHHFGMNILAPSGNGFRRLARIKDTGPIAWHQVAVELPVTTRDTCRLRLEFLPGNWMVDWVGAGFDEAGPARTRDYACAGLERAGSDAPEDAGRIRAKDRAYLVTGPADCFYLSFRPGPVPEGMARTWFVRSEGYYTEWLRPEWLAPEAVGWFRPEDGAVMQAARLWLDKKPELERKFFELRIEPGRTR